MADRVFVVLLKVTVSGVRLKVGMVELCDYARA